MKLRTGIVHHSLDLFAGDCMAEPGIFSSGAKSARLARVILGLRFRRGGESQWK